MGVPMKMIQEWLGHSVFQTTANRYSHLATDAKNIVADSIAEKLNGNGVTTGKNDDGC
jgi:integrase